MKLVVENFTAASRSGMSRFSADTCKSVYEPWSSFQIIQWSSSFLQRMLSFSQSRQFLHFFLFNLTISPGHHLHVGDAPLHQMMFRSFKFHSLATSRGPEISVTNIFIDVVTWVSASAFSTQILLWICKTKAQSVCCQIYDHVSLMQLQFHSCKEKTYVSGNN